MPKLNQIIAVANGQKGRTQKAVTEVYHKLQKEDLLKGISRTYHKKDDAGHDYAPEHKRVTVVVKDELQVVADAFTTLFDVVATQDAGNCVATADVKIGEETVLPSVPVTTLLFLEKQLKDIHTLVEKLPTLEVGEDWQFDQQANCYATPPRETVKTRKVPFNHEIAPATKEHPAQVKVLEQDVIVGTWDNVHLSGKIRATERQAMLRRVEALQDAVKLAREEANSTEISQKQIGENIFAFVLGK